MAGVGFADGDEYQIVEHALRGHADISHFGELEAHEGEEDALDGFAHVEVFHGRGANDGRRVDGGFAMRHAGDVEDRVVVIEGVEAGMVAEGTFVAEFAEFDVAFEDVFGVGGDFEVHGFALDHFDGLGAEEAGEHHFVEVGRGEGGWRSTWCRGRLRWRRRRPCV